MMIMNHEPTHDDDSIVFIPPLSRLLLTSQMYH